MKILMVLTYYYPHWTGLTAYAQRLAEGLAARGHQVTVLSAQYRPELAQRDRHNGVDIVRLPTMGRLSRGVVMPSFPTVANRLIHEHDVVQLHTPLLEAPLVTWLANRAGKKVLFTHHGDVVMPAGLFNQFVGRTTTGLMTQALRWCAAVSIHSHDYAVNSSFLNPFMSKMHCIYPPIEIPQPIPEQVAAMRREFGLDGAQVVGFAGRFVEEKGFDYLLQAVPMVAQAVPEVKFVYAGERNVVYENFYARWSHLVDASKDRIVFVGLLTDRQRLADFMGMCDLFALPSRTDCFPSVQIEAMLCGAPTVTTDIPGAREAVKVSGAGKLVAARDPRALAEGIIEVLRSPEPYRRTREQLRQVFSTERTLEEYEALLQSLCAQGARAPR
jgi:glycosyltransferase involved in cell wall biosynthesis